MIYPTYRFLTSLSAPLLQRLLCKRLANGKEHKTRWTERMGEPSAARPEGKLLWIHGASVGESLSALPLIRAIRREEPDLNILMTTGTVTSAALMEKRLPENCIHQFMPLDHPQWVNRFLDHWRPNGVVWLESELWPNMIISLQERNIHAAIVNGRMSEKSYKHWKYIPFLPEQLLASFEIILPQTAKDANFFIELGGDNVQTIGNLKFAGEPLPYDEQELAALQEAIGTRPMWLFASTHANEEEQAGRLHKTLKEKQKNILSIILLRHPNRGDEVMNILQSAGLSVARRSTNSPITPETDIYLVDTMGETGLFFALSDIVAMGGSYVAHGGHNPIEPSAMNCATIVGPYMFNFIDICHQMDRANAIIRTDSMEQLGEKIFELLQNPQTLLNYKNSGMNLAEKNRAVLPVFVDKIMPLLG